MIRLHLEGSFASEKGKNDCFQIEEDLEMELDLGRYLEL